VDVLICPGEASTCDLSNTLISASNTFQYNGRPGEFPPFLNIQDSQGNLLPSITPADRLVRPMTGTLVDFTYQWDYAALPPGPYTIQVNAYSVDDSAAPVQTEFTAVFAGPAIRLQVSGNTLKSFDFGILGSLCHAGPNTTIDTACPIPANTLSPAGLLVERTDGGSATVCPTITLSDGWVFVGDSTPPTPAVDGSTQITRCHGTFGTLRQGYFYEIRQGP